MEAIEKPQLIPRYLGEQFRVLEVAGNAGAAMPLHFCTSETVIAVQQGQAIFIIDDKERELSAGKVVLLPANKVHSLKVIDAFKAIVLMSKDAAIKFADCGNQKSHPVCTTMIL